MGSPPPIAPLDASEIDLIDAGETRAERFWRAIPVLGWMISSGLWERRARPIRERLCAQLEARPESIDQAWGEDPAYRELALQVCEIARKEMGWPNARFIPEDPWRVVFWSFEDGLDTEVAMGEIEEKLGVSTPGSLAAGLDVYGSLGQFVAELKELRP